MYEKEPLRVMNVKDKILRRVVAVSILVEIAGVGCVSSREDNFEKPTKVIVVEPVKVLVVQPIEVQEPVTTRVENCLWKYRKDASGVVITDHLDKTVANLVVPETIEGQKVVGIEQWALACRRALETVVIPGSVRTIGEHAFYGCSLHKVEMGEGILKIDKLAFSACYPLKSVSIPKSVVSIGLEAFPSWCEIKGVGDVVIKAEHDRLVCKKLEDAAREEEARWRRQYAERMRKANVGK